MKAVLKYPLRPGMNIVEIPGGLCCPKIQHQPGQADLLQFWQVVDTERPPRKQRVLVAVTGETLPEGDYEHLATVQLHDGAFVMHVLGLIE